MDAAPNLKPKPSVDIDSIEKEVLGWCRDLGLHVTSSADDFFEAGGTSLTAVRLIARTDAHYGEDVLSPEDLYERSSIGQIVQSIHTNLPG